MEIKDQIKMEAETQEKTGEELLKEYMSQDKDTRHTMGYSVYAQTHSDGCCC